MCCSVLQCVAVYMYLREQSYVMVCTYTPSPILIRTYVCMCIYVYTRSCTYVRIVYTHPVFGTRETPKNQLAQKKNGSKKSYFFVPIEKKWKLQKINWHKKKIASFRRPTPHSYWCVCYILEFEELAGLVVVQRSTYLIRQQSPTKMGLQHT